MRLVEKICKAILITGIISCISVGVAFADNETVNNVNAFNNGPLISASVIDEAMVNKIQQEARGTTTLWSGSYSQYSFEKPFTVTWFSNEEMHLVLKVNNTGSTPIYFSVSGSSVGTDIGMTVNPNTTKYLSLTKSDIDWNISQGTYTSSLTARAVDANYSGAVIKFSASATLNRS